MSTDLAVISQQPQALIALIAEAAKDPNVDAAKMRELWALTREISEQDAKGAFYRAMQAVQKEIHPIVKETLNGGTKTKYAKLEKIDREIRPIYTDHGFSLTFGTRESDKGMCVTCEVMHRDGYSKSYELAGALDSTNHAKTDVMATGSTVSYYRRYLTCLIWNIVLVDEDKDGQAFAANVTKDQVNQILDMFTACNLAVPAQKYFLEKFMGVSAIEQIPARDFSKAITALQSKHREQKQRG